MKKINEIFYSLQGEGRHTGKAVVFVRFSGCNLNCPFCDTEFTSFTEMTDEEIIEEVCKYPTDTIVLTGGEPSLQVTEKFVEMLHDEGKYVHIETNGTIHLPQNIDYIVCSPKDGGKVVQQYIDELKVVYTGQDLKKYDKYMAGIYYLQPCSGKNTEEVIELIKKNPKWRLSLQTHKILNIQ